MISERFWAAFRPLDRLPDGRAQYRPFPIFRRSNHLTDPPGRNVHLQAVIAFEGTLYLQRVCPGYPYPWSLGASSCLLPSACIGNRIRATHKLRRNVDQAQASMDLFTIVFAIGIFHLLYFRAVASDTAAAPAASAFASSIALPLMASSALAAR